MKPPFRGVRVYVSLMRDGYDQNTAIIAPHGETLKEYEAHTAYVHLVKLLLNLGAYKHIAQ